MFTVILQFYHCYIQWCTSMFILFKIRNSFPLLKIKSIKKIEQMIVYSNVYFNIIHTILLIIINGELVLYLYIWGQFAKV